MGDDADSAPLKGRLSQLPGERRELPVSHIANDDDNSNIFDTQLLAKTLDLTEALRHE